MSFMKKGGQVTIFVIVAIVVVIAIAGFYFLDTSFFSQPIVGSGVVRDSIVECLDFTSKNALYVVAYQGGYNDRPEKIFDFSPTFFPYYYYEGSNLMPSISFMEEEMGNNVRENLGDCLESIDIGGFDLSYGAYDVSVAIVDDGVEFIVDMPVSLSKEEETMTIDLSDFPVFHEAKLLDLYEISRFFVEDQVEDSETYCITCVNRMANEAGINFYLFPILDDVVIVMAFEDKEDPLVFNFVNKYGASSLV